MKPGLALLFVLTAACSGDSRPAIDASPYFETCDGACPPPYECVTLEGASQSVCLVPCQTGGDCPWVNGICECTGLFLDSTPDGGPPAFFCICPPAEL